MARTVVEEIPAQGAQERHAARAKFGKKVVLAELLALPKHRLAFGHEDSDKIRLQHVPTIAVALGEKRIACFVGIIDAEITDEALMIVVLNVLQRGFRNPFAVGVFFFGITEQSERES